MNGRETIKRDVLTLLAVFVLVLSGCGKPNPADRPKRPSEVTDFTKLYENHCRGCHGTDGRFGPAPPLNDALFLAIISDDELSRVITSGRKGTLMPAFAREHGGPLTPAQVTALIAGLRSTWSDPAKEPPESLPPYLLSTAHREGNATGNVENGAKVFARSCANCHGADGRGGSRAGALNDQAFLQLVSDQLLRRIAITGRPDLGMWDFRRLAAEPLSPQDIQDVVAYVAAWRDVGTQDERPARQAASSTQNGELADTNALRSN